MKKILGLDLGTNSIGWSLIQHNFNTKEGEIRGVGSRIIPMSQDILGKFDSGVSNSQTAERTGYRGVRRLRQRHLLRRERLHRVLNLLEFLPKHYADAIDFEKHLGKFKNNKEVKLNYRKSEQGKYEFIFIDSFNEMVKEFKDNRQSIKIPFDWTLYYLRKKALSQKISKQELAWILLNFNQKRGYYQLRGEEEETDDKIKTFETLKVKELIDTGDTIKGKDIKLYEVYFENGWKYDKTIAKTEDWIGKTKEFIVSTSTIKSGEIKRTFKAVDSEKDWIAIKKKTEQHIEKSNKTVGQFIYETLLSTPSQKIRGKLVKTIERKFYKKELKAILKEQIKHHPELDNHTSKGKDFYRACIQELYPRNEAHQYNIKEKGFDYLFIDDIIFYQRPLKSKKSTIAGCQYETRTFKKTITDLITGKEKTIEVTEAIKAISKSHPLYQEFRLWQFLKNLKLFQKEDKQGNLLDKDVTLEFLKTETDWTDIFDFLNRKSKIKQSQLIDFLSRKKGLDKKRKSNYRWNYVEDKEYPCNETKAQLLARLQKVKNIDAEAFLTNEIERKLWHIIYSVKDKNEFIKAIENFALKNKVDKESFVENFAKFPPYKNEYGAYSEKALKKMIPLMCRGIYFDENAIPTEVKERILSIMERVKALQLPDNPSKEQIKEAFEKYQVVDDDIPIQLVKSFIPFKNTNPFTALNTYQAGYAIYNRHSESGTINPWKTPNDIDTYLKEFKQHSLRNPIVEQVVTETLRVVRDIWQDYGNGAENFFDEIHVELGREMKNSADKRKKMTDRINENENTNHRIKELLKELMDDSEIQGDIKPHSPSHQEILKIYEEGILQNPNVKYDIVKEEEIVKIRKKASPTKSEITRYKLWLEQGYTSPYTGDPIPMSKLFTTDYQIEHIIPQSRYFDNSLSNKVICESEVNQLKDNQTAYEFLKNNPERIVDLGHGKNVKLFTLKQYESHCNKYFKNNKTKLKKLLSEDILEGFIERQLNDSRYISKIIKSLLSNIVREDGEREATSKNLIPVTGSITAKLKQDWGLNDKWNALILPRFKRLNRLTGTNDFTYVNKQGVETPTVPDALSKGFSKKRIDHRHHALDALVIACCTQKHTHYLSSLHTEKENYSLRDALLIKNKEGHYTKHFQLPWNNFPVEAKDALEKIIVSFKQNLRVINKTNNKTWQWVEREGILKKQLVRQTKGDNWAIRKPLHKETVSGKIKKSTPKGKIATASRVDLSTIKNRKQLEKITDTSIQIILNNHLKNYVDDKGKEQFDLAFSQEGIEQLNTDIIALNNGKHHHPIYKVRLYEIGNKFKVGYVGNKKDKYVEAAKGTNLFFAIYWNEEKKRRVYETIPLNEVIEHQKQVAYLPRKERTPVPIYNTKGTFLFSLSPNDLVYVPTDEELVNPKLVNVDNLCEEQMQRTYKMVSSSGIQCFFIQTNIAKTIQNKVEFSALNKMEKSINNIMIKDRCWKLKTDRLGKIEMLRK